MLDASDPNASGISASETTAAAAVKRADALLVRFGLRMQEARAGLAKTEEKVKAVAEDAAYRVSETESATAGDAAQKHLAQVPARPAAARADAMLNQTGERLGQIASAASLHTRRFAALAREEAEDLLADAQALRRSNGAGQV